MSQWNSWGTHLTSHPIATANVPQADGHQSFVGRREEEENGPTGEDGSRVHWAAEERREDVAKLDQVGREGADVDGESGVREVGVDERQWQWYGPSDVQPPIDPSQSYGFPVPPVPEDSLTIPTNPYLETTDWGTWDTSTVVTPADPGVANGGMKDALDLFSAPTPLLAEENLSEMKQESDISNTTTPQSKISESDSADVVTGYSTDTPFDWSSTGSFWTPLSSLPAEDGGGAGERDPVTVPDSGFSWGDVGNAAVWATPSRESDTSAGSIDGGEGSGVSEEVGSGSVRVTHNNSRESGWGLGVASDSSESSTFFPFIYFFDVDFLQDSSSFVPSKPQPQQV
jgi:hypothetical protein